MSIFNPNVAKFAAPHPRINIGPLALDCVDSSEAMSRIEIAISKAGAPLQVVTANAQFLGMARRDAGFARVVQDAGLVVADGMPIRWLALLQHSRAGQRITGHDLLNACAATAAVHGYTVGFLGSAPGVAERAVEVLKSRHPSLNVAGIFRGDFEPDGAPSNGDDAETLLESIRQARPDILFVALGCPKQEMWSARYQRLAGVPVTIGVGGVLDVLAGRFKRAPLWVQRTGMEWAYRLSQDPRRLWKRYILQDIPTLSAGAWDAMRYRYFGEYRKS